MIKYSADYIARFDEKTRCAGCGKEMRRRQRTVGYIEDVCVDCARKGYRDKGNARKHDRRRR